MEREYDDALYGAELADGFEMRRPSPIQLHEMQPPTFLGHQLPSACLAGAAAAAGAAGAAGGGGGGAAAAAFVTTEGAPPRTPPGDSDAAGSSGYARKCRSISEYDDDTGDDARSTRTCDGKKQNHSEIEKRRRDKMNTYITELSSMVPMCAAMARKLDKLTVLRMTVQHLKSVRGAAHAFPEGRFKPPFLSERELKMLILQAADGFLFVADCDRGRMLYVSESVGKLLRYTQSDLLGQSLFDILHPKDVAKVKEQLSSSDLNPRERLIDAKTMLPVRADLVSSASRMCPGARRSFFCRMKLKPGARAEHAHAHAHAHVKQEHEAQQPPERKYCVVRCTGYLKAVPRSEAAEAEDGGGGEREPAATSCLVAVGRGVPELPRRAAHPPTKRLQFVSRHAPDGKFLYVDQRATPALGYLPQELLGTSLYEYAAPAQVARLARAHKAALLSREPQSAPPYALRRRDGSWAGVQTDWRPFRNPWTEELEWLVASHTLLELYEVPPEQPDEGLGSPYFVSECASVDGDREMQEVINSQLESHKIGAAIADVVLRAPSPATPPRAAPSPAALDPAAYAQAYRSRTGEEASALQAQLPHFSQVRNNVTLSEAAPIEEDPLPVAVSADVIAEAAPPDGNDEAAMAVIMSLLEADAGLGGPVDFSELPWPLP